MKKRITGIVLSAAVFIGYRFVPVPQGLEMSGMQTLALLVIAILLWVTEAMPLGISSIFVLVLPMFFGLATMKDFLVAFPNPTLFFVLATFGLSAAISKVPTAKRILLILLEKMGSKVHLFILAMMLATALISSIMSNIPATVMFMGLAISFLELYDSEEERRRTGRAIMIALPIAGMIGGTITPAGSSNNILALGLLEEYAGVTVRFVDWMAICIPVVLVMLPLAWLLIIKIFRPAPVHPDKIRQFILELKTLDKPGREEKMVVSILVVMILLWILSSWIPALNVTLVSICGLAFMFLPGIDILHWKDFKDEVSWDVILMIGSVLCIGNLILENGVASWLADTFFRVDNGASIILLILQLAVFMYIMQLVLPNAPAVITSTTLPVTIVAEALGINAAVLVIPLCIFSSWTMILPLSAVPMMTYSKGYYSMMDIGRAGIPILVILALVLALWIPFICGVLL